MNSRRAFTLVELLVVVGIVAMLIGLLLPAVNRATRSGRQVRAMSDMRELLAGYAAYHQSHRGALLLGYTPPTVNGVPVLVHDPISGHTFGLPVADRYPWRLLPWVGRMWAILHNHTSCPPLPTADDAPTEALHKAYILSLNPSFGINSVFLGGHAGVFKGFAGPRGDAPNVGKHVVFRSSEVRRASEQIVFAEVQVRNASLGAEAGLHYVTPPRAGGQRWKVVNEDFVVTSGMITGIPKGRWGKRAVVGFFDGHAAMMLPSELEDMRLWASRATRPDFDF